MSNYRYAVLLARFDSERATGSNRAWLLALAAAHAMEGHRVLALGAIKSWRRGQM